MFEFFQQFTQQGDSRDVLQAALHRFLGIGLHLTHLETRPDLGMEKKHTDAFESETFFPSHFFSLLQHIPASWKCKQT